MKGMRELFAVISAVIILSVAGCIGECVSLFNAKRHEAVLQDQVDMLEGKVAGLETENQRLIDARVPVVTYEVTETPPEFQLTDDEIVLIAEIVHAEAGNQDMLGKRLVVDVILNRMEDDRFPETVAGVVYQEGQFAEPSLQFTADDVEAVMLECERRIDTQVLWFRTGGYHGVGQALYQHGAHYFSGRDAEKAGE